MNSYFAEKEEKIVSFWPRDFGNETFRLSKNESHVFNELFQSISQYLTLNKDKENSFTISKNDKMKGNILYGCATLQ